MGISIASGSSESDMELVDEQTLTATATSITITHTIDPTKRYLIVLTIEGAQSNGIDLYGNSDTTTTNYYRESLRLNNAVVTAGRANAAEVAKATANETSYFLIDVSLDVDSKLIVFSRGTTAGTTAVETYNISMKSVNAFSPLTSLTLTHSTANGFGIGTICKLYEYN
jgi:hypothetical protein